MNLLESLMAVNPATGWAIVGVLLLIAEVLLTPGFIIPFSVSAFLVALLTGFKLLPMGILWQGLVFAVLGVGLIPVCRWVLNRFSSQTPDINQY